MYCINYMNSPHWPNTNLEMFDMTATNIHFDGRIDPQLSSGFKSLTVSILMLTRDHAYISICYVEMVNIVRVCLGGLE